jgi:hypothetical protein
VIKAKIKIYLLAKAMQKALNLIRNQQREEILVILKSSLKLRLTKIMRASTARRHL